MWVPRVAPWFLSKVHSWTCFQDKEESLLPPVARSFLEHASSHKEFLPVLTNGSESDTGVGFGVVFPDFCRGSRHPSVTCIFTAGLLAILYALKVNFTLWQQSYAIFCKFCNALKALGNSNSSHPLVLAILEWLVHVARSGWRVNFCWVPAYMGSRVTSGLTPWPKL